MKSFRYLMVAAAVSCTLAAGEAKAGALDLKMTGFPSDAGMARIVLLRGETSFLGKADPATIMSVPIRGGEAVWQIEDIASGEYALVVHHDGDENNELNRPLFGVPVEPYGYSNGVWTSFGVPQWEKVRFAIGDGIVRQAIRLRTNAFVIAAQAMMAGIPALALVFCGLVIVRRFRSSAGGQIQRIDEEGAK